MLRGLSLRACRSHTLAGMAHGTSSILPQPDHLTRSIPAVLAKEGTSYSFEFFPPKDDAGEQTLWEAIRHLEPIHPTFVSVTYGAGGSTRDRTVRMTGRIARETTLMPMAHLTCVGSSIAELRQVVGEYAGAGIRNVLALRGDPPGGPGTAWTLHPEGLNHADELVALIRSLGSFTVGVAAFPDQHPESSSLDQDADVLVRKADAGAEFAVTQFVFDADSYVRLRDRVVARGRNLPIIPGLMPVTSFAQVRRMAEMSGTPLPAAVVSRLEAVADDAPAIREVGVQIATELSQRLLAEGAPGLHFYTMNRSLATLEVYANLGV
jgi:methylenetetrahydrofolate reductase (NADPH)